MENNGKLKCCFNSFIAVADLDGKAGGEIMGSSERVPIMGSGGFAPSGVQGHSPLVVGVQGAMPPEVDEILANKAVSLH